MTTPIQVAATPEGEIAAICARFDNDPHRMLDILLAVQDARRCVSPDTMDAVAAATGLTRIAVEGVASFYSFLSREPKGRVTIRLCDDIVDRYAGLAGVVAAFEAELGISVGETSADGAVSLEVTPCIGMCDQAPAAMINDLVATRLTPDRARDIARGLRQGQSPAQVLAVDAVDLAPLTRARALVDNNIRLQGEVILGPVPQDAGLRAALPLTPMQIIDVVEDSGLRGCGGAGYVSERKWHFAAAAPGARRYIICNADEGEPGTFKDRVVLTERADLVFEGMTIAARAINAREGILYLRGEYLYLRDHLEQVLAARRARGALGSGILGQPGFDFDIRIQMGAGAYICGEEGALISSCEGLPGEPKTRPPFPVTRGYLGYPTVVNNVETFAHAARILDRGAAWFRDFGTEKSPGTKLFSISGDCTQPGGLRADLWCATVRDLLAIWWAAADAAAVQVGGPSGTMIARDSFDRRLMFRGPGDRRCRHRLLRRAQYP